MIEDEVCDYDWRSVQERLAFLLYQLATKVIGERIKVDPAAADSAIRYCLHRVTGGPYIPERQEHFLSFIEQHGGSIEWVMWGDITPLIIGYAAQRAAYPRRPYRAPLYPID